MKSRSGPRAAAAPALQQAARPGGASITCVFQHHPRELKRWQIKRCSRSTAAAQPLSGPGLSSAQSRSIGGGQGSELWP